MSTVEHSNPEIWASAAGNPTSMLFSFLTSDSLVYRSVGPRCMCGFMLQESILSIAHVLFQASHQTSNLEEHNVLQPRFGTRYVVLPQCKYILARFTCKQTHICLSCTGHDVYPAPANFCGRHMHYPTEDTHIFSTPNTLGVPARRNMFPGTGHVFSGLRHTHSHISFPHILTAPQAPAKASPDT